MASTTSATAMIFASRSISGLADTSTMVNFNNLKVNGAYVLAPTFYLPNFLLGVSSFKDSLFFSVGHNEAEVFSPILDDFFNIMEDELKKIGIDGVLKVI